MPVILDLSDNFFTEKTAEELLECNYTKEQIPYIREQLAKHNLYLKGEDPATSAPSISQAVRNVHGTADTEVESGL